MVAQDQLDRLWSDLIGRIYDSVQTPEAWPAFLEALLAATESVAAGFHVHDLAAQSGSVLVDVGADPSYVQKYHEYYARINPWSRRNERLITPGQVVLGFAERDLVGSEYYEDFWKPQGFYDSLSSYVQRDRATASALIAIRPKGAVPFEQQHVELFRRLSPHLQRAVELQRKIYEGLAGRDVVSQALDCVPYGIVVVNERRKVIAINRAAQDLVDRGDCLSIQSGELSPSDAWKRRKLCEILDGAIRTTLREETSAGGTMELSAEDGHPIGLVVTPVRTQPFAFPASRPAALILLSADPAGLKLSDRVLTDLYGLTPTEARVATSLATGGSVEETAKNLRITLSTARTHLKRIFDKTGTRRQGELVSLLLRDVAALELPIRQR